MAASCTSATLLPSAGVWRMEPTARRRVRQARRATTWSTSTRSQPRVSICRRRSGGGLVLLDPAAIACGSTWSCPRRCATGTTTSTCVRVGWVTRGSTRCATLGIDAAVHRGPPPSDRRWDGWSCFAGVGAGEVLVGDRKLVGLSQRRTVRGARFQCVVHRDWEPDRLLALLGPGADDRRRRRPRGAAARNVAALPEVDDVLEAVLDRWLRSPPDVARPAQQLPGRLDRPVGRRPTAGDRVGRECHTMCSCDRPRDERAFDRTSISVASQGMSTLSQRKFRVWNSPRSLAGGGSVIRWRAYGAKWGFTA